MAATVHQLRPVDEVVVEAGQVVATMPGAGRHNPSWDRQDQELAARVLADGRHIGWVGDMPHGARGLRWWITDAERGQLIEGYRTRVEAVTALVERATHGPLHREVVDGLAGRRA